MLVLAIHNYSPNTYSHLIQSMRASYEIRLTIFMWCEQSVLIQFQYSRYYHCKVKREINERYLLFTYAAPLWVFDQNDFGEVIIDRGHSTKYLVVMSDFCHIKFGWYHLILCYTFKWSGLSQQPETTMFYIIHEISFYKLSLFFFHCITGQMMSVNNLSLRWFYILFIYILVAVFFFVFFQFYLLIFD